MENIKRKRLFHIPLQRKRSLAGIVFVLPVVIGFFSIFLPALIKTMRYSFSTVNFDPTILANVLEPAGLSNYKVVINNVNFNAALGSTVSGMAVNLPVIVLFAFFLALVLNSKNLPGRTFFRIVFFLPVIMNSGAASTANSDMIQFYSSFTIAGSDQGLSTNAIMQMGQLFNIEGFITQLSFSKFLMDYVISSVARLSTIVNSCGIQVLIFLAALQSVPTSVFEAAQVEGLTGWEMFWKITLPMISPMILVNIVYTAVDSFGASGSDLLNIIERETYTLDSPGTASAMSMIYFAASALVILVITIVVSRFVFYDE